MTSAEVIRHTARYIRRYSARKKNLADPHRPLRMSHCICLCGYGTHTAGALQSALTMRSSSARQGRRSWITVHDRKEASSSSPSKTSESGISRENLSKDLGAFLQDRQSPAAETKRASDLVLSIVREIIRAHSQNINVISTEGVGTEFIFTLATPQRNRSSTGEYPEAVKDIHLLPKGFMPLKSPVYLGQDSPYFTAESLYAMNPRDLSLRSSFPMYSSMIPAFRFLQPLFDLGVNALAIQLILVQQCNCRAGLSEYVLYADAQYRSRSFLRKCLANSSAKTADDGMLLYGYNFAGCLCCSSRPALHPAV